MSSARLVPHRPSAIELIAQQCGRKVAQLELTQRLVEDLGLDGLDRFDLAIALDSALGIDIPDGEPQAWVTVEDVIQSVRQAAGPPALDLATTRMGAIWRANAATQTVTVYLSFPGRLAATAALPVAGIGMSFAEKQLLAENIAQRLNVSSASQRGS